MSELNESAWVSPPLPKDEPPPDEPEKEPVTLRFSVFFDGTGNNRGNINARKTNSAAYQVIKKQNPAGKGATKVGSSVASFESDFSNIALMEETFDKSTGADHHASVYVEGVGTYDLRLVAQKYEEKLRSYQQQMELISKGIMVSPTGYVHIPSPPKMETDSTLGNATALASSGLKAKIDAGVQKILEAYEEITKEKKIDPKKHKITEIYIDVFGFSRGAATARSFIHHISSGTRKIYKKVKTRSRGTRYQSIQIPYALLIERMEKQSKVSVETDALKIKFAGLFDTVSSHANALSSDVEKLKLDAVAKAEKAYHLCAAEEHRMCFSLTNISSSKDVGKGEEYFLPGVHSDIGGGYREEGVETEDYELINADSFSMFALNFSSRGMNLDDFAETIESEGWYRNNASHVSGCGTNWQIKTEKSVKYYSASPYAYTPPIEYTKLIKAHRCKISNHYRCIPLQLMSEATEKSGISFKPKLKSDYKVPGSLSQIDSVLRSYISSAGNNSKASDWMSKSTAQIGNKFNYEDLRNSYLHYSSRMATGFWPRLKKGERYREIYKG